MSNKVRPSAQGTILDPREFSNRSDVDFKVVWTPTPAQLKVLQRTEFEVFTGGAKFTGKGTPFSEPVLTPLGFRPMGEIKKGSILSNPDGSNCKVAKVFPLGVRKLWKFTFSDGSSTRVTDDHLWLTRWNSQKWLKKPRFVGDQGWRVCVTSDMITRMTIGYGGDNTFQIPVTAPCDLSFGLHPPDLSVDPYVLGVLLGDGYLGPRGISITTTDESILEEIYCRTGGFELTSLDKNARGINWRIPNGAGVLDALGKLGLVGKRAWEKSVPERYLLRPAVDRYDLLQGLMDTDGYVDSRGLCSYTTVSTQLALDVQWLARSLGGNASISTKQGAYTKGGVRTECRLAYNVWIKLPKNSKLFKLSRKTDRCIDWDGSRECVKGIETIYPDGEEEAQCIQVDNPNSLYITKDFIVTHNTELSRMWMIMGNLDQPDCDEDGVSIPYNRSYVYHPDFLGAVIRLNEKELSEWVDRAIPHYCGVLGGWFTRNPAEFRWPSGARIFLGHAGDSNAWTKYQGQNLTRFLIEEAGQIPTLEVFDMIRSCCRSTAPEMRAQILLTANPGGKGAGWIFDRYIEPKDREGKPLLHPTLNRPIVMEDKGFITLEEKVKDPFSDDILVKSRVWAPMYFTDNPHALKNKDYIGTLATMTDEKMKKAYLFGDWKALQGRYFDIFSKAHHTYDPATRAIASWWKPSASLDWGYKHDSAAYFHKRDPDTNQQLIYKEFCVNHTDPVELGAELARQALPELSIHETIVFHVSHDLFNDRIGDMTWVEMLGKGAERVIGQGRCYIPDVIITRLKDEAHMRGETWSTDLEERILSRQIKGIVWRRAPKARAVGFMYMRSLMRLTPLIKTPEVPIDWETANKILENGDSEQYANFIRSFQRTQEILPQLLISQACPRLIDALPKAQHSDEDPNDIDKKHFSGMDQLDSCFVAGTMVSIAGGSIPIETIQVGQLVRTSKGLRPVLSAGMTIENSTVQVLELDNGSQLMGTSTHPIWVRGKGFKKLYTLKFGDEVQSSNGWGDTVKVKSVMHCKRRYPVYNLQVEDTEEYFANGILVHNCRYLLTGVRDDKSTATPPAIHRLRMMENAKRSNPNMTTQDMIWIARNIEDMESEDDSSGFTLGRGPSLLRRLIDQ